MWVVSDDFVSRFVSFSKEPHDQEQMRPQFQHNHTIVWPKAQNPWFKTVKTVRQHFTVYCFFRLILLLFFRDAAEEVD